MRKEQDSGEQWSYREIESLKRLIAKIMKHRTGDKTVLVEGMPSLKRKLKTSTLWMSTLISPENELFSLFERPSEAFVTVPTNPPYPGLMATFPEGTNHMVQINIDNPTDLINAMERIAEYCTGKIRSHQNLPDFLKSLKNAKTKNVW